MSRLAILLSVCVVLALLAVLWEGWDGSAEPRGRDAGVRAEAAAAGEKDRRPGAQDETEFVYGAIPGARASETARHARGLAGPGPRVIFFDEARAPVDGLRVHVQLHGAVEELPVVDGSAIHINPRWVGRPALVRTEACTPTLITLPAADEKIVLRRALPIDVRVEDGTERAPLPGARVRLAPLTLAHREIFATLFAELGPLSDPVVTDADGHARLAWSVVHDRRFGTEYDLALSAAAPPSLQARFGADWRLHENRAWSGRRAFPEPVRATITLHPLARWAIALRDLAETPLAGASARVVLPSGRAMRVEAAEDGTLHFDAPHRASNGFQLVQDITIQEVEVSLPTGARLWLHGPQIRQRETQVVFDSGVLPARGRVTLAEGTRADSYLVGSYPDEASDAAEDLTRTRPESWSFPLARVAWQPVAADGSFEVDAGWIGASSWLLLRDRRSGRVVDTERLRPGRPVHLAAPADAAIRVLAPRDALPEGVRLVARPWGDGSEDAEAVPLTWQDEPLACFHATVPPGEFQVRLQSPTGFLRWTKIRLDPAERKDLTLGRLASRPLEVAVRGTVSGPLANCLIWMRTAKRMSWGPRVLTDATGRARIPMLVAEDRLRLTVRYPKQHGASFTGRVIEVEAGQRAVDVVLEEGTVHVARRGDPRPADGGHHVLRVRSLDDPGDELLTQLGDDGTLELTLPVGRYRVELHTEQGIGAQELDVTAGSEQPVVLPAGK